MCRELVIGRARFVSGHAIGFLQSLNAVTHESVPWRVNRPLTEVLGGLLTCALNWKWLSEVTCEYAFTYACSTQHYRV